MNPRSYPHRSTSTQMKVILLKPVAKLGDPGNVKDVSGGYARNFLIPRKLAEPATEKSIAAFSSALAATAAREEKDLERFKKIASKLEGIELRFALKTGEKGQTFGSISTQDIADKLAKKGITINRHWIDLEHGIKDTGEHTVKIKFPQHIKGAVKITVSPDN